MNNFIIVFPENVSVKLNMRLLISKSSQFTIKSGLSDFRCIYISVKTNIVFSVGLNYLTLISHWVGLGKSHPSQIELGRIQSKSI